MSDLSRMRIMVVDDNTYTLRLVRHTLEQAGYQVSTAVSGEEALTLIKWLGAKQLLKNLDPEVLTRIDQAERQAKRKASLSVPFL